MVLRLADSWSNWNFEGAGKTREPGKKPLGSRERTNNKLNAHLWRRRRDLNPGHIGGRRVLSPLHHPCALKTINGCPWPIQRNLFGSTYVWFHLFMIIMLNDVYDFFLNLFLEFSLWPRKRSERYLKIICVSAFHSEQTSPCWNHISECHKQDTDIQKYPAKVR